MTPYFKNTILIEKNSELTSEEKKMFGYFGENARIRPPFRILNPHLIHIGDKTSIREGAFIHAYTDLSYLLNSIDLQYRNNFKEEDYLYQPEIHFGKDIQVGRFLLLSCTKKVTIEDSVVISERVFIGDNNHTFSHPHVPILFQPNKKGEPVVVGTGSWLGIGSVLLPGTHLGKNCVVGSNAVVEGKFPAHAVIAMEKAKMIFRRFESEQ